MLVTEPTYKPRGRPKKDDVPFLQNPNRIYVALVRVAMATMKQPSIRAAAKSIAAEEVGNEIAPDQLTPDGREIVANCPPNMITRVFGPTRYDANIPQHNTRRGAKAVTIKVVLNIYANLTVKPFVKLKLIPMLPAGCDAPQMGL